MPLLLPLLLLLLPLLLLASHKFLCSISNASCAALASPTACFTLAAERSTASWHFCRRERRTVTKSEETASCCGAEELELLAAPVERRSANACSWASGS